MARSLRAFYNRLFNKIVAKTGIFVLPREKCGAHFGEGFKSKKGTEMGKKEDFQRHLNSFQAALCGGAEFILNSFNSQGRLFSQPSHPPRGVLFVFSVLLAFNLSSELWEIKEILQWIKLPHQNQNTNLILPLLLWCLSGLLLLSFSPLNMPPHSSPTSAYWWLRTKLASLLQSWMSNRIMALIGNTTAAMMGGN